MPFRSVTRRQGGLISRDQLLALNLTRGEIWSALESRRLEPTRADRVYRAAGSPHTADTPAWFAVLSTQSPLSYVSAAHWWDVPVEPDGLVHITRLDRRRLDWPAGVRVHRVALDRAHVTRHRGLVVTTRTETLLDCLGWLRYSAAASLADRAKQQSWLTEADVGNRLENQPGRWGNRQLRRLIGQFGDDAAAESERRLQRLLRQAHIDGWTANLPFVTGGRRFEIDIAFPELRLAIEVDGRRYHSGDDRFQTDRTKQNALIAAGWRVLRFTWADINDRPSYVLAQITALLAA